MSRKNSDDSDRERPGGQLLHLVFGGELKNLETIEFSDPAGLHIVGIYPDYASAYDAWKNIAQRTVDDAHMRYFIVHLHRLLDPLKPTDGNLPTGSAGR